MIIYYDNFLLVKLGFRDYVWQQWFSNNLGHSKILVIDLFSCYFLLILLQLDNKEKLNIFGDFFQTNSLRLVDIIVQTLYRKDRYAAQLSCINLWFCARVLFCVKMSRNTITSVSKWPWARGHFPLQIKLCIKFHVPFLASISYFPLDKIRIDRITICFIRPNSLEKSNDWKFLNVFCSYSTVFLSF